MSRFRVVICGGGIAAVEGLLRLRARTGDSLEITLVAPQPGAATGRWRSTNPSPDAA